MLMEALKTNSEDPVSVQERTDEEWGHRVLNISNHQGNRNQNPKKISAVQMTIIKQPRDGKFQQ